MHAFKIKVFSDADQQELAAAVTREVVETGTVVARLFWRAKQVTARVRLHTGDIAIAATVTGKTGAQMAQAIVTYLDPVMRKLGEWLTARLPL